MHVHDSCCFFATCMRHAVLSDRLMHSRFGTDWDLSIKNLGVLMHFSESSCRRYEEMFRKGIVSMR